MSAYRAWRIGSVIILGIAGIVAARGQGVPPDQAPPPAAPAAPGGTEARPAADAAPAASTPVEPIDPRLDEILTRLEQREVSDLRAGVAWRMQYVVDLPEDATTKRGRLWYQQGKPTARFMIHFSESIQGDRREKTDERHGFDGEWYTDYQARSKSAIRTQVRRPDDPDNPFDIARGLFPLPFGQKKADILREFQARLVPPAAGDPPDTDRVELTPREGTRIGTIYGKMDFWIARAGRLEGLPIRVKVAKKDGTGQINSHITITFDDVALNAGFPGDVFKMDIPKDFQVTVEPLDAPPQVHVTIPGKKPEPGAQPARP
ncbi:MAG: hypothetical protein IPM13_02050 [Phycisphaerales bacterium]|nr:hypothetical protein [Phycisphaerales bacterium]